MCGIMGFSGGYSRGFSENLNGKSSVDIVLNGLKSLEYRGYDSSGIAYYDRSGKKIKCIKKSGKLVNLSTEFSCIKPVKSDIAIGHIRWATHGKPTDDNAHPHMDCSGNIAIVHNGIIENYAVLKSRLIKKGHKFITPTDSEVIAHLIEDNINEGKTFYEAVRLSAMELSGAFAVLVLNAAEKSIAAVKYGPPLVMVHKGGEVYFASDVSPLIEYSDEVIYLKNSEIAYFHDGILELTNFKGKKTAKTVTKIDWDASRAVKTGFSHFMQKEIFEQPSCLLDAFSSRVISVNGRNAGEDGSRLKNKIKDSFSGFKIMLEDVKLTKKDLADASRIVITACGSSYYAGLAVKYMAESICGIPVIVEYGSEFRYENFPISKNDIFIGISQSGETADTNSALELAKAARAGIISITNVPGSQITAMSDKGVIYTHAGPEIGVASTKAFTTQLLCGLLLALRIREIKGYIPSGENIDGLKIFNDMVELPKKVEQILFMDEAIKETAKKYYKNSNFLYLGRGILYPIALEGALKLKEISYIHAEGYPAGEMKHGPIALVDENMPVLFLLSNNMLAPKTISNIEEIKARGGKIIAVADYEPEIDGVSDLIKIPETSEVLSPILYTIPLQLLAYHIAALKGTDIDQPRNLAKSVTVE
ncbi:MAG: glutamine--fructose-6-phosphate transaminase (isomerizing) [Deltaproteobacteria bacterium]|jgi:glucosamine--fructose-6-phosphate aminotransferase (isomerizing)|nr:glutamine--fructose-6-phosphate transaminase (isomerizing) [Deltaproteobacteria bacterium]MDA8158300.1 glutamine--fructose-6-phosphate transaminase (isomerizing) [Deltaproteobacteria bacterium]